MTPQKHICLWTHNKRGLMETVHQTSHSQATYLHFQTVRQDSLMTRCEHKSPMRARGNNKMANTLSRRTLHWRTSLSHKPCTLVLQKPQWFLPLTGFSGSTPLCSVKALCCRLTCHALSRLQMRNSRKCRPWAPSVGGMPSVGWTDWQTDRVSRHLPATTTRRRWRLPCVVVLPPSPVLPRSRPSHRGDPFHILNALVLI